MYSLTAPGLLQTRARTRSSATRMQSVVYDMVRCPSVCLSHAGVLLKRLNGSNGTETTLCNVGKGIRV